MAKVLAYEDAEGVKVVIPVPQPGMTEARALELAALPILGRAPVVLEAASLPQVRDYRGAWSLTDGQVVEDLTKARAVALARCRAQRNAKLVESDGLLLRAQEAGTAQDVAQLKARRQALRDLPAAVGAALKAAPSMAALRAVDLTGGL